MNYDKYNKFKYFLCLLSGEDLRIIKLTQNKKILNSFTTIGFFVLAIFLGSLIGAVYLMSIIFDLSIIFNFIVALFWSLCLGIIYVFLLYTITPALLPSRENNNYNNSLDTLKNNDIKKINYSFGGFVSILYKYLYILIIALFVSQPVNILLFYSPNKDSIRLIEAIKNVNHQPISWIFTTFAFMSFLLPVILKYRLRRVTKFYKEKQRIERDMVEYEYIVFKVRYSSVLNDNIASYNKRLESNLLPLIVKLKENSSSLANYLEAKLEEILKTKKAEKYEHWQDAPFNIQKKEKESYSDEEEDLLNEIYSN